MAGIEAGLSATGDIFEAIARRAGTTVAALSQGLEAYRAGQTGLLRLTWDNGDRTVLVNPELGGVTLGWKLTHTAQDELFAAIEGTAFHTRVILERMEEHGVPIRRVINGGGVPQKNEVLNRVYANVLNKPVLVPESEVTSLGSAIFAFLAAGTFKLDRGSAGRALPAVTEPSSPTPPRRRSTSSSTRSTEAVLRLGAGRSASRRSGRRLARTPARSREGESGINAWQAKAPAHSAAEPQPNPTNCLTPRRQGAKTSRYSFASLRLRMRLAGAQWRPVPKKSCQAEKNWSCCSTRRSSL